MEEHAAARIMWEDLRRREEELLRRQAAGETISEEEERQFAELARLASYNPYIQRLLQAEYAFAALVMEVQRRIGQAAGLSAPSPAGKTGAEDADEARAGVEAGGSDGEGKEAARSSQERPDLTVARPRLWLPGDPV